MIILLISNNITHNLSNRKDNLLPFYKNIRKDGASLFYISFAEAEYFQPCNALAHLNPSANSNKFELVPYHCYLISTLILPDGGLRGAYGYSFGNSFNPAQALSFNAYQSSWVILVAKN